MLVVEFFGFLRKLLADEQEPYLWGDDELLIYLKSVLSYVFMEIGERGSWVTVTTESGRGVYPIGQALSCSNVILDGNELVPVVYSSFYTLDLGLGRPRFWSFYDGKLHLAPVPDGVYSLRCFVRVEAVGDISYGDVLPVSSELFDVVVRGMLWQAYSKQDSEVFDVKKALDYKGEFFSLLSAVKMRLVRDRNVLNVSMIHPGLL